MDMPALKPRSLRTSCIKWSTELYVRTLGKEDNDRVRDRSKGKGVAPFVVEVVQKIERAVGHKQDVVSPVKHISV